MGPNTNQFDVCHHFSASGDAFYHDKRLNNDADNQQDSTLIFTVIPFDHKRHFRH